MKKTIKKILKYIQNDIKLNYKSYIVFLLIVPWFFIKFDYYIYSPGGLINLDNRIKIDNDYKNKGSFNLTYVTAKEGIAPLILLSYVIPSWDLVKVDNSRIENESSEEIILRNQVLLKETSYDAIIAAFSEANISYNVKNNDVVVLFLFEENDNNIKVGDIIKSIDDKKINKFEDIKEILKSYKKGDKVKVMVERDGKIVECYSVIDTKDNTNIIGVYLAELKKVETNPSVEYIFKDSESGASRGLMCALEIYSRITKNDLTKGSVISGTGSIDENGIVGAIDGVKYKLAGAVKNKADVFIIPTDNYEEALKLKKENNYDIEIIEGDNFHNVVEKLQNR